MDFIDGQRLTDMVLDAPRFVWELMTPPPISPIFKEGGVLKGYNEDVCQLLGALMLFAVIDFCFVRRVIVPKARYFCLHTICNALVCYVAWGGVKRVFTEDALTVFTGPADTTSCNNIIAALHLYHCLAFSLSADDIFHHLTFCATLCMMAVPAKQVSGASVPFGSFFLSGLPGGIDYLMLTLCAHGYVSKDFQKKLYVKLNVWMRAPAMTIYLYLVYITSLHTDHPVPLYVAAASCYLHFYNGQFYCQQAIESNALFKYKKKLEAMGVKVPDVKLSDLHKEDPRTREVKSAMSSASPSPSSRMRASEQ